MMAAETSGKILLKTDCLSLWTKLCLSTVILKTVDNVGHHRSLPRWWCVCVCAVKMKKKKRLPQKQLLARLLFIPPFLKAKYRQATATSSGPQHFLQP